MTRVALEPATAADFEALVGRQRPPVRMRALTAKLGEQPIGIGGFLFMPDGSVWASMLVLPDGRKYPAAILRAGVMAMRLARKLKLREVWAKPDAGEPAAERYLVRLGFKRVGDDDGGEPLFRWRP